MTFTNKGGVWVWDYYNNGVMYQPKDPIHKSVSRISRLSTATTVSAVRNVECEITMMGTLDSYAQARFRRHFQRKVKMFDTAVATIQDLKDVAIFSTKPEYLFPEFISYFHTTSVDRFLRSMTVYLQFYLQVWDKMQLRRKEATRKLRQPIVTQLENEVRDNLADLRSMVSRDYAAILIGIGDAKKFHHMNNKNNDSMSEKDRHLLETLIFMTVRVVWIALFRKHLALIEKEINRLMRTYNYSPVKPSENISLTAKPEEERVLLGKAFKRERKLLHRSPAIQEIIFDDHDYKLLSIGINDIPGADERIRYLEIAYAAPEELLVDAGIAVGVLGVQRKYLDPLLKPKELSTTVKRTSVMKTGEFKLPPKSPIRDHIMSNELSHKPCRFKETETAKKARIAQCKMWRSYLEMGGVLSTEILDIDSVRTVSMAPSNT